MALTDVDDRHMKIVAQAQRHLATAEEAYKQKKFELMYFSFARAAAHIDHVLEVIERIKDKPRNESPNGPMRASKNG